jgi:hypothetical protein
MSPPFSGFGVPLPDRLPVRTLIPFFTESYQKIGAVEEIFSRAHPNIGSDAAQFPVNTPFSFPPPRH